MFTNAIKKVYKEKKAGGFDLPHAMEARCIEYFDSHTNHHFNMDGGKVASALIKTFEQTERPLTRLIAKDVEPNGRSAADVRAQNSRMVQLSETVQQLYEDFCVGS